MPLKSFAVLTLIFAAVIGSGCSGGSSSDKGEILVSAAVSLKNAFEEIGAVYEDRTGVRVRFNFGASGLLQQQIETGAPVDVFASAAAKNMDELQAGGLIIEETRRDFVGNRLVLAVAAGSSRGIQSFTDLSRQDIARIALGNPKTVPAGSYAMESLR
ncbi:MAG TPA: molybdate ABC transporter substrate-binding protein, partial [Acidobacteriota bacterium]|nr:molybdate ABC transporter substrate-binding protein [Acidobacteriota bacterium]